MPKQVYQVKGKQFNSKPDAMLELALIFDCQYIDTDWLDVTSNQDAAENRQVWINGVVRCFDLKDGELIERHDGSWGGVQCK